MLMLLIVVLVALMAAINAFTPTRTRVAVKQPMLKMEYIPDGMSKAQWKKLKEEEANKDKGKNLGAVGITKFKSRSFEAWQKSGGKNLFPVDPNTPEEEKPYMQRKGGKADGSDLKKKGLFGRGQGVGIESKVDDKYDKLEKEGKLKSTTFEMPWSNSQVKKIQQEKIEAAKAEQLAKNAGKKVANKTGKLSKYGSAAKAARAKQLAGAVEPDPEPAKKKKLFGLF